MIPGRKRKGWNRHTIKEAAGRHAVRRVCPLLLPWKTHLLGVFVIANTVLAFLSPVCFSARFVMAGALFGTFCYRRCAFRHVLLSPAHLFGTICHGRYVFPALLVIVNMVFRRCLGSLEHDFVCFLPIVWIFSTSSIFILTGKTAAAKGCPLGTAVLFTPFSA